MTTTEILTVFTIAAIVKYLPPKIIKDVREFREERSHQKAQARSDEIDALRKEAGLKELRNSSMSSGMKYRGYADAESAAGRKPLSYNEFYGYVDSKTYIRPDILERLKELDGLRG
jgi:hypothetical protein